MSKRLFLSVVLLLCTGVYARAQQLDRSDWNPQRVDSLIALASSDVASPTNQSTLESAVLLGKKIDYRDGVVNGSDLLIRGQHNNGDYTGELRSLLQLLNYLKQHPDDPELPEAWFNTGNIYFQYGVFHKAAAAFDSCLHILGSATKPLTYPAVRKQAWSYQLDGDFGTARTQYLRAMDLAREANNPNEMLWIHQQRAHMCLSEGDYKGQLESYQHAYALADGLAGAPVAGHRGRGGDAADGVALARPY